MLKAHNISVATKATKTRPDKNGQDVDAHCYAMKLITNGSRPHSTN